MFLRSNLAAHGVEQGDHDHSTDFFLAENGNMAPRMANRMAPRMDGNQGDSIAAVFGVTKRGYLLAQAPDAPAEAFAGFAAAIYGRQVIGMTGASDAVEKTLNACGLRDGFSLWRDEPLYRLSLSQLEDADADIRAAMPDDFGLLATWFRDDMIETQTTPAGHDPEAVGRTRAGEAPNLPVRLLIENGKPVAMAAINARVADVVQLGGVYVPPDLRRAGRGRRVVIGILSEARANGANTAILFAASAGAARIYETIGFERIGSYKIALLAEPMVVSPMEEDGR